MRERPTGEELYRRFLAGDQEAMTGLVRLYRTGLILFIDGFVHNSDEAEELMLDTFVRLMQSGKHFAGKSTFKTYLFAIAKNLSFTYLKKQKNAPLSLDSAEQIPAVTYLPDVVFSENERKRELYTAMRQLKSEYCQVLCLLYFENMTYAEAGTVMNRSERAIDGLAYRAKKALRDTLEARGFIYEDI